MEESEARANRTLIQLEKAKKAVETLDDVSIELERSRAHVKYLEEVVSRLNEEGDVLRREAGRTRFESGRREAELEAELRKSRYQVESMKTGFKDKERECEDLADENERLKSKIEEMMEKRSSSNKNNVIKIGLLREEADRSERKAARVMEQLEAAQKASLETEGELRRLKVQSDQWRKAAEMAAAMVSSAWNDSSGRHSVERTCSMDRFYSSPFSDELCDEDFVKRKNGNVMSFWGVLWKKQHK